MCIVSLGGGGLGMPGVFIGDVRSGCVGVEMCGMLLW